jgi:hypothetical protein
VGVLQANIERDELLEGEVGAQEGAEEDFWPLCRSPLAFSLLQLEEAAEAEEVEQLEQDAL